MIPGRVLSPGSVHSSFFVPIVSFLAVCALFFLVSCKSKSPANSESVEAPKNAPDLVFTYGSEKEKWVNEVTTAFNRGDHVSNQACCQRKQRSGLHCTGFS